MRFAYTGFTVETVSPGVNITFDAKPDQTIINALKANGFRWQPVEKFWYKSRGEWADFVGWLDKQFNPERPDGDCWVCKQPGKLRSFGAATPVLCETHYQAELEHRRTKYQGA